MAKGCEPCLISGVVVSSISFLFASVVGGDKVFALSAALCVNINSLSARF